MYRRLRVSYRCSEMFSSILNPPDTDEQLAERIKNFNSHIAEQRNVRRREEANEQDKDDELAAARKKHVELNEEHGQLIAEAKVKGGLYFRKYGFDELFRHKKNGYEIVRH